MKCNTRLKPFNVFDEDTRTTSIINTVRLCPPVAKTYSKSSMKKPQQSNVVFKTQFRFFHFIFSYWDIQFGIFQTTSSISNTEL